MTTIVPCQKRNQNLSTAATTMIRRTDNQELPPHSSEICAVQLIKLKTEDPHDKGKNSSVHVDNLIPKKLGNARELPQVNPLHWPWKEQTRTPMLLVKLCQIVVQPAHVLLKPLA